MRLENLQAVAHTHRVIAKGQGTRPFTFRGPLTSITAANSASTAETSLGWTTLEAYGVVAGQGEVKARLGGGAGCPTP